MGPRTMESISTPALILARDSINELLGVHDVGKSRATRDGLRVAWEAIDRALSQRHGTITNDSGLDAANSVFAVCTERVYNYRTAIERGKELPPLSVTAAYGIVLPEPR